MKSVPESVDGEDLEGVPLFEESGELAYIAVTREDPEEGFLGKLRPTATEADLRKKWGGGTYSLSPRSSGGKYLKGLPARELIIAGDPIFSSRAAELKWKRAQGIADDQVGGGANGGGARGEKGFGLGEIMVMMSNTAAQARQEAREAAELRAREADANHQRQLELMRIDLARREAELKAERERMAAEAAEREQRLSREMSAERERQRDHMTSMLQLVKERGKRDEDTSPMQMLTAGIKLALDLKGDGEGASDPVTALANNLPEILAEARSLVMAEKVGGRVRSKPDDDEDDEEEDDEGVKLEGEVGVQAKELVARLEAQGRDPAVVLAKAFAALGRGPRKPPATAPAPIETTATTVSATPAPAPASPPDLKQSLKNGHAAQKPTRRPRKSTAKAKPATA